MKIVNMEYAPIIGYQNKKTKDLSRKIAKLYNESIDVVNNKLFLGFDLKRCDEMKDLTASFNFEDNVLEIHVSEGTSILVPSRRIDEYTACRLFEFTNVDNIFDKMHIMTESRNNKFNIVETRTGKGKASSWFSDKMSSGISSAYSMIGKDITIKNPESIQELGKNINDNIKSILKFDPGQDKIVDVISGFVVSGNVEDINFLYEKILESSIKSKYVEDASRQIMEVYKKLNGEIKKESKSFDSKIDSILANIYNTNKDVIEERMKGEGFTKKLKSFYTYMSNGISALVDIVKAAIASFITYKFTFDGIITSINKAGGWIIEKILDFVSWLIGPSKENIKAAETLTKSDDLGDQAVGYLNKAIQAGQKAAQEGLGVVKSLREDLTRLLSDYITGPLDELIKTSTAGKVLVYSIVALIGIYAIIKFKNVIYSIIGIVDESRTSAKDAFMNFNIESLTTRNGFDRIFAIEAILAIISSNIKNALEKENFTNIEKARLKKLNHLILNSSKSYKKGVLKVFVKDIKRQLKSM